MVVGLVTIGRVPGTVLRTRVTVSHLHRTAAAVFVVRCIIGFIHQPVWHHDVEITCAMAAPDTEPGQHQRLACGVAFEGVKGILRAARLEMADSKPYPHPIETSVDPVPYGAVQAHGSNRQGVQHRCFRFRSTHAIRPSETATRQRWLMRIRHSTAVTLISAASVSGKSFRHPRHEPARNTCRPRGAGRQTGSYAPRLGAIRPPTLTPHVPERRTP